MRKTQGFVLFELLIILALVGIIATMAIPQLMSAKNQHDINKTVQDISDTCTGMKKELNVSAEGAQNLGELIAAASPLFAYTHKKEIYYSAEFMDQCATHPMYLELESYDKKDTTILSGDRARDACAGFEKMVKECNLEVILPKLVSQVKNAETVDSTKPAILRESPATPDAQVVPEPVIHAEVPSVEPVQVPNSTTDSSVAR